MGLFTMKNGISDEEWRQAVTPLFKALRPYTQKLANVVEFGSPAEQVRVIQEVIPEMVPVVLDFREIPKPTSRGARRAWSKLDAAAQDAIEGSRRAMQLHHSLRDNLGSKVNDGSKRAVVNVAYQKNMFEGLIRSAEVSMREASAYFYGL